MEPIHKDSPPEEEAPEPHFETAKADNDLEQQVVEVLRTIYDPEIPVNIYDLGLIYEVKAYDDDTVFVRMTLTAPNCPVAESLPREVEYRIQSIPDVVDARVQLTFDPPFTPEMMSDEVKLALGFL